MDSDERGGDERRCLDARVYTPSVLEGQGNDEERRLHQKKGTTCVNERRGMWLVDLARKDRAASPVGRGRRGEGMSERRERADASVRGRHESEQRTKLFVMGTGRAECPDGRGDGRGRVLMGQRARGLVDKTTEQPCSGISIHGASEKGDDAQTSNGTRTQRVNRPERRHGDAASEGRSKPTVRDENRAAMASGVHDDAWTSSTDPSDIRTCSSVSPRRNCAEATQRTRCVRSRT
jgi:hypothetical protein